MGQNKQKQINMPLEGAMPANIFFSVVIPLYNKERHIRRSVDSVLNQSYSNFELIVVNDGSTDKSVDALNPLINHFTLINKENGGESSARNTGIYRAKYQYIAFLDADDEWDKDFLQSIVEMINLMPECHIFSSNYLKKDRTGTILAITPPHETISEIDYFEIARKGNTPVSASSVCVSADLFAKIGGFPEHIRLYPDLYFWTKAAIHYRFAFYSKPMAIYHRDADNRICNLIIPTLYDTPFEALIEQGKADGLLSGSRLRNALEFVCHYKLQNAFKSVTQRGSSQARKILRDTRPVTTAQKCRKWTIFLMILLPESVSHFLWLTLRRRQQ